MNALIEAATAALRAAHAPYSKFRVGAAVRTSDGRVFAGCNVENASYGLSICAERVAIFNAVSQGAREIAAIAVCTEGDEPAPPCGACRQVIAEFARDPTTIVLTNTSGRTTMTTLAELLPRPFRLDV
jgi:cytidine deaminase